LVVHCLSRTPSTKKTQVSGNYSALSLRFGAFPPPSNPTAMNHQHPFMMSSLMPSSQNNSEIIQIKDERNNDEVRNFACSAGDEASPYQLIDHPYQSVVRFGPSQYEPSNISCSQQTTTTTVSCDSIVKCIKPKKGKKCSTKVSAAPKRHLNKEKKSFAQTLKKCTLIFKSDSNSSDAKVKIGKKNSCESISNSSLKEIDEEEFTSAELAQIMCDVNKEIRHINSKS
jgi:hypothetical protein